jgi:hypothetical protein
MKQSDLNRAVPRATGETVKLVRQRGFLLVIPGTSTARPEEQNRAGPNAQGGKLSFSSRSGEQS